MPAFKRKTWNGYLKVFHRGTRKFPVGLLDRLADHLEDNGYGIEIDDRAVPPGHDSQLLNGTSTIDLRPYQIEAVTKGLEARTGIFSAATGTGKTEIMGELIRITACRTLILIHQSTIAWQTIEDRFEKTLTFPNATDKIYGMVGDGVNDPGLITAAMYQTLHMRLSPPCQCGKNTDTNMIIKNGCCGNKGCNRRFSDAVRKEAQDTIDWLGTFDAIHLDEAHRVPAKTWFPIVMNTPAYWRFAYSATPFKSDNKGTEMRLVGATGEVIFEFPAKQAIEEGYLTKPHYIMVRGNFNKVEDLSYQQAYKDGIEEHRQRNQLIADIAGKLDVPTLVLVIRKEQGKMLRNMIKQNGKKSEFLKGTDDRAARKEAIRQLQSGEIDCLIATTIFDEGIDAPAIGALILAGGGKAHHLVIQRIGRGIRLDEGKEYTPVFDFLDDHSVKDVDENTVGHLWKHSRERLEAVKNAEYDNEVLTVEETMARLAKGDMRNG